MTDERMKYEASLATGVAGADNELRYGTVNSYVKPTYLDSLREERCYHIERLAKINAKIIKLERDPKLAAAIQEILHD